MLKVQALAIAQFIVALISASSTCNTGFSLCSPPGATNPETPSIDGPDFSNLYVDLLHSSLPHAKRDSAESTASLCCISSLSCLSAANLNLPFCYDMFTTDFYLPDTSYGTLSDGSYTSAAGDSANLQTGDYKLANGTVGNIYSDTSDKPDTATLPIPTQFTASGVGSAIPASGLGGEVTLTYTITFPTSTIPGTTIQASTMFAMQTQTVLFPETTTTTVSGSVEPETFVVTSLEALSIPTGTAPGTTVQGKTVPGSVATLTTTEVGVASPTASKKSEGRRLQRGAFSNVLLLVATVYSLLC